MSDVTKSEYPDYAYILFDDICGLIGPSEHWPKKILELFWSRNVGHWDRFMLCTFIVVNGLNPEIFLEWIDVIGMATDKHSVREFKSVLDTFIKKKKNPREMVQSLWLQHF